MPDNIIPITDTLSIKASLQGSLIYLTMMVYIISLLFTLCRFDRLAARAYFVGFLIAVVSVVWRWIHLGHIPLQNMFEVFLVLGASSWPVSWFSRRFLGVRAEPGDVLLSIVFLFPAGMVFSETPSHLPPALQSPLFGPHVMTYMLAYFIMAKASLQAILSLFYRISNDVELQMEHEKYTYRMVRLGFPFLTFGLILGSIWGKLCWGDYWNWDPKELWSLASWLVFLIYFHWRYAFGRKYPTINSLLVITAMLCIVITLLWVNLSRLFPGLHNYATGS